ncbi:MBL fold metallo-hydrolase [Streptomyces sp. NPDC051569]|uniref:MBL fold metallo-hydrolase n=1 Tax=Streptomyces sp. NPDC051569 TaxID=3365661 RepID=UPI0037A28DC1
MDHIFRRNIEQPYVLQRLTERVWWFSARNYTTLIYVGPDSVFVLDPLDNCYDRIVAAVETITDKPIKAILYSHFHVDHIGDAARFVEHDADIRIIASAKTAAKLDAARSVLPRPNQVVDWPRGSFTYEGLHVELYGFEWAAHTEDHAAWLLPEERILHSPDLVNPDEPPFWRFAANERFLFTEDNLREVTQFDWDFFCGGHGNVGSRADIEFQLAFIAELKQACVEEIAKIPRADFARPERGSHTAWLADYLAAVGEAATARLRPTYGGTYGFEVATRSNAEMIAFDFLQYR